MNFDEWWDEFSSEHEDWRYADSAALRRAAFQAGAASRDAEIERLKNVILEACAMERAAKRELVESQENCDQLRAELATAIAACKAKDEAVKEAVEVISSFETLYDDHTETIPFLQKALAIQPDDAALKAWLGKPVSYLYKHTSAFGDGEFWSHRPYHNGVNATESKALYSPKGLK